MDVAAKALTREEVKALLAVPRRAAGRYWKSRPRKVTARRDYLFFRTLANTGFRCGEAAALTVEDISAADGLIRVQTLKQKGGPREEWQPVLDGELVAHLQEWASSRRLSGGHLVFQMANRTARKRYKYWARAAGVSDWKSLHGLRHFYAMELVRKGEHPATIRALLRHRDLNSTMVYVEAVSMERVADNWSPIR